MVFGVLAALAAGACFAVAGVLQQSVAAAAAPDESLSVRLLANLVRRPLWLAGIGVAFASYAFQALALSVAPLALVQPLMVTELLFAIPASARLRRVHLSAREWSAILCIGLGLAVALWGASPQSAAKTPGVAPVGRWAVALAVVSALALAMALAGRRLPPLFRAPAWAAAAGIVLGTQSGLLDETVHLFADDGIVTAFTSWAPYVMTVASLVGLLLVQSAYQAGPLAVSLPVLDTVEPMAAALVGVAVLGETIDTTRPHLTALAAGALVLAAGIVALDTSPAVQALHRAQDAQQRHALAHSTHQPSGASASCRAARRCHGTLTADQLHTAGDQQAGTSGRRAA